MNKQASAAQQAEREAHWRERLARHATSGQSIVDFCRAEGVAPWSFYHWRKQLAPAAAKTAPPQASNAPFIELGPMPVEETVKTVPAGIAAGGSASSLSLRIELGGGIVLHLTRS